MKIASETLYKETLPKNQQVGAKKTSRFRWGKTTSDVSARTDLPFSAKVLMDVFAQLGEGHEIVTLSQVVLAAGMGSNRGTVQVALDALEKGGLIAKHLVPSAHAQIQAYRMLHPALIRREKGAATPDAKTSRKVALVKCLRCRRDCVPNKAGWCRSCRAEAELDARIDRRIKRASGAMAV